MKGRIPALILAGSLCFALCACGQEAPPPEQDLLNQLSGTAGVKTDYSGLSPYKPLEEKFSRLTEGPMPSLTPSDEYGPLLPYQGKALFEGDWGYEVGGLYGLVTLDGTMVTDAVYTGIRQPSWYDEGTGRVHEAQAYVLEQVVADSNGELRHSLSACALDGSWVVEGDYGGVYAFELGIILVGAEDSKDFLVLDEQGRTLMRGTDLPCYEQLGDYNGYQLSYGWGEGVFAVSLVDESYAFMEQDGSLREGRYDYARAYSDGLAFVQTKDGNGYINQNGEMVLSLGWDYGQDFHDGMAMVNRPAGGEQIIDKTGRVLLELPGGGWWYGDMLTAYEDNGVVSYYDKDLQLLYRGYQNDNVRLAGDGLYSYDRDDRSILVWEDGTETELPKGAWVEWYAWDNLVGIYMELEEDGWGTGVMTREGEWLLPAKANRSIQPMDPQNPDAEHWLSCYESGYSDYSVSILDETGQVLIDNLEGFMGYDHGLFRVTDGQSAGYMDREGNWVFRLSLLESLPD